MIYCQCECIIHEGENPGHWTVPATRRAKLIFGTYFLCEDCDNNCYDGVDHEQPSVPHSN
jgi:hypothetical protein